MQGAGGGVDGTNEVSTPEGIGGEGEPVPQGSGLPEGATSPAGTAGPEQGDFVQQEGQFVSGNLATETTSSTDPAGSSRRFDATEDERDPGAPISGFRTRGGTSEVVEDRYIGHRLGDYRFVYARAGDLTIEDVGDLLIEYKELVLKYVALSKAVEATRPFESVATQTADADLG